MKSLALYPVSSLEEKSFTHSVLLTNLSGPLYIQVTKINYICYYKLFVKTKTEVLNSLNKKLKDLNILVFVYRPLNIDTGWERPGRNSSWAKSLDGHGRRRNGIYFSFCKEACIKKKMVHSSALPIHQMK